MFSTNFKISLFLIMFIFTFTYAQPTVNEHSIKFQNTTTATLVGEDGVIMKTTNNGASWEEQSSGITNVLYGYSHLDENISFAVGENGVILKTIDGGATWVLKTSGTLEHLKDVEISESMVIVCGDNGKILSSEDLGETWMEKTSGVTEGLRDLYFNYNVGFAVGENSALLKTEDNGNTWVTVNASFGVHNINSIGVIDENKFTVVCDSGYVTYTLDGGLSWNDAGSYVTSSLNDIIFFNSNEGIIVGDNAVIMRTYNGGSSWEIIAMSPVISAAYDLYSISFGDASNGIVTGNDGIEMYTIDGGLSWSETPPAALRNITTDRKEKNDAKLNQNYPNPFNPSTVISYELPLASNVSVKIYDISGKEVASLVSAYQTAGVHTVNFNASNLSSGVYFYMLRANSGSSEITKTMRMILTK